MKFNSGGNDFSLWRSLAISLALHAWLLAQATMPAASRAGLPLTATLRQVGTEQIATVARSQTAASVHGAADDAARMKPAESDAKAMTALASATARRPTERPLAPLSERVSAEHPAAGAGPDADGLRQYRLSLASATRRFKRYPALALDSGLSGRAEVQVVVAANGLAEPPQLASSSGHELLDQAALEMISRAVQLTRLPQQLRGQAFAFKLPVLFELDGE